MKAQIRRRLVFPHPRGSACPAGRASATVTGLVRDGSGQAGVSGTGRDRNARSSRFPATNAPSPMRSIASRSGPDRDAVAQVKRLGLANWIEQQLHPERITDDALDSTLARLTTLELDSGHAGEGLFRSARAGAQGAPGAARQRARRGPAGDDARPDEPPGIDEPAIRRDSPRAAGVRGARRSQAAARRLQRAAARRSARRLLVQPLQRLRAEGRRPRSTSASTSATRSARTCSAASAICSERHGEEPGDARSISTTG